MRKLSFAMLALAAACGGPAVPVETQGDAKATDTSDAAIAVVRRSFDAMGGIDRLRLAGAKARIPAVATVDGKKLPVEIAFGGPDRFRLDYVSERISYVFSDGACRKIAYGLSVKCADAEAQWRVPMRILTSLTFPAADAAQLGANLRLLQDKAVGGAACAVVELRPKGSTLKLRAAFDKASGLLTEVAFDLKDAAGARTSWIVGYGDFREVKKMKAPFTRGVSLDGAAIWSDEAASVDFDGYDEHIFDPPLPPTVDEALPYDLPARRFVKEQIGGVAVELPAPPPTVGGAWIPVGTVVEAPASDVVRIVHRGPVSDAALFLGKLKTGATAAGKTPSGEPGVILLERPDTPDAPVLMMMYVAVAAQTIQIKITP
jgi:hypothetical protein